MPSSRLNPARILGLHASMRSHVDGGAIPGIVTLVARGAEVHVDAVGTTAVGGREPMRRDSIFRIASLTKPITAAAVLMLVEDGVFGLDDSVNRWLPELTNRRVLRRLDSPLDDTVPALRAISVRDLLTSCFGFGSILAMPGTYPIQEPVRSGRLGSDGPPRPSETPATDEWMRRFGALPLLYQPGERWAYDTSSELQGILVARASGRSFETFLRERLFEPLGMKDTAFSVPDSKRDRLAGCYQFSRESQKLEVFDGVEDSAYLRPPAFESGAGGLLSTIDDYFAFCHLLLNRGRCGREQVLSEATVAAMTRDQLTAAQRVGADLFFGNHTSWGFGMAVNTFREKPWNVPGRFGWDGGFGTSAYSDPTNDFVGILMTQRLMDSPEPPAVFTDFWSNAYRTLED